MPPFNYEYADPIKKPFLPQPVRALAPPRPLRSAIPGKFVLRLATADAELEAEIRADAGFRLECERYERVSRDYRAALSRTPVSLRAVDEAASTVITYYHGLLSAVYRVALKRLKKQIAELEPEVAQLTFERDRALRDREDRKSVV